MEQIHEMREEIYEITEPKLDISRERYRRIFKCELCRNLIDESRYICSVNICYDLKSYYHRSCFIRYLQFKEMNDYDSD